MGNNKNFVSFNAGEIISRNTQKEVSIQVPAKATGDIKEELPNPKGLAKASPIFKKVNPEELSEEEKKKAIAKNLTKVPKQE